MFNKYLKAALIVAFTSVSAGESVTPAMAAPSVSQNVINKICAGRTVTFQNVHWNNPLTRKQFHRTASHKATMTSADCRDLMGGKSLKRTNKDLYNLSRDWRDGTLYGHAQFEKMYVHMWRMYQEAVKIKPSIGAINIFSSTRSEDTHFVTLGGNRNKKRSTHSQHVHGTTLDFGIQGMHVSQTSCIAKSYRQSALGGKGGLGYYSPSGSNMVHFDLRGTQANWGPAPNCNKQKKIDLSGDVLVALRDQKKPSTQLAMLPENIPVPEARPVDRFDYILSGSTQVAANFEDRFNAAHQETMNTDQAAQLSAEMVREWKHKEMTAVKKGGRIAAPAEKAAPSPALTANTLREWYNSKKDVPTVVKGARIEIKAKRVAIKGARLVAQR